MTRMTLTTPTIVARAQKRKMTVATCVSANGKPPSVIKWDTRLKGEATYQETRNQNGTVTVRSNYVVIPSRETHKQKLTCIVTYRNERITDSVVLNVQCKTPLSYYFTIFCLCFYFVLHPRDDFVTRWHHSAQFTPKQRLITRKQMSSKLQRQTQSKHVRNLFFPSSVDITYRINN